MLLVRRCGLRTLPPGRRGPLFARSISGHTNIPLDIDPTLRTLLKEDDISLGKAVRTVRPMKELEVVPRGDQDDLTELQNFAGGEYEHDRPAEERKSPAAFYGSRQIGQVVLPNQLQNAINILISDSDKTQLRSDAKRLFYEEGEKETKGNWNTGYETTKYRSRTQASRHAERDGTAFASIALPAHYSAILAVFDHLKRRLEPTWKIERVIDWGAGTGSGLWAATHAFQKSAVEETETSIQDKQISDSSLISFLGIDKRDGLVSIGKRLVRGIDLGGLSISWRRSFKEEDQIRRSEGHDTLALSAFMLTSLPTPQERKALAKEMWESGAHVMVFIDHNTKEGFEAIAQTREYLLNMGRKEFEDAEAEAWPIRGSHVVAPCPHDGVCPLYHSGSSRLVCGFSQRVQRPSFVRRTKHSGIGHEDVEYSYVVIRRGPRPSSSTKSVGRVGEVGRRALEKDTVLKTPAKELQLHSEYQGSKSSSGEETSTITTPPEIESDLMSPAELQEALRLEAFDWPRLTFPPLKRSGHVILDSCTAEGKIVRMTIPKSQGKQPYYDARKSSWGDLFPHPPKNPPQERYQPQSGKAGKQSMQGADIGKHGASDKRKHRPSYDALSQSLKNNRKKARKERIRDLLMDD